MPVAGKLKNKKMFKQKNEKYEKRFGKIIPKYSCGSR